VGGTELRGRPAADRGQGADGAPEGVTAPLGDVRILFACRTARAFGAGALSVALALDLASAYSALVAGVFLAVSMAAASVWALAIAGIERAIGRRRAFVTAACALAAGGLLLYGGLGSAVVVLVAVLLGGILAGSADLGPLPSLEQATLATVVPDSARTDTFSRYNFLGYVGNAAGALLAAPLSAAGGRLAPGSGDLVLLLYGFLGLALVPAYLRISRRADRAPRIERGRPLSPRSRRPVLTLAGLFSVDAFGGGLVANFLVTLWLRSRYDASGEQIGLVLALAMVGAAVSLLLAAPLARRFGLVNTMVFTHMPSSVLLVLFAFAPSLAAAGGLWLGRSLLSQMDVPTRQSFVQALVAPDERTTAAAYTTAARSSAALGGPVTGELLTLGGPWAAAPFVMAGSLKVAYDAAVYARFRRVPVPEERTIGNGGGRLPPA
jgi:MFS family permease